ncbi:MAG: methylthioribulose 1-phosphate dehydratase [Vicinamibacterales bacterium]
MATPRLFQATASSLARIGRRFSVRGWVPGTSGNFSAVVSRRPFRLAITASGIFKHELRDGHILRCDERGEVIGRVRRKPSAETLLHVEVVRRRKVGAVLHTHSVWSTVLSERHAAEGGLRITGYEMLKGLRGATSHEHQEWIPILENDQNIPRLARLVGETLDRYEGAHAFLLRRHGLYTWGATLAEAERHVEILEFLFEAIGRIRADAAEAHREERHGDSTHSRRKPHAARRRRRTELSGGSRHRL